MTDSTQRVMLLIDADNVSTDIIEQACARLHAEYGALHVRRAYCTAESAVKHQLFFKRLSIKPMVNLAAGKNSTDIALAVDALDLVLAERPDVVVIASSDSDFAPLVSRLREKGCLVRGVGQAGKVGEETPLIYDDFIQFEHRSPRVRTLASDAAAATPAKRARSPRKSNQPERAAADDGAAAPAKKTRSRRKADEAAAAPASAEEKPKPARKTGARKTAARKAGATTQQPAEQPAEPPTEPRTEAGEAPPPAKKTRSRKPKAETAAAPASAPAPAASAPPQPDEVAALLRALPGLAEGKTLELQYVSEKLRRAGLLSKRNTSRKLLGRYPQWFDLQPEQDPQRVSLRSPG